MGWRKRLFPFVLFAIAFRLSAQLPDGAIAPDFTAQDITGQTQHLYDLLDSGKIVVIEISATWCAPCWVYHTSHFLEDLYQEHGPEGDDKLRVLWIEGDPNTNLDCIYGAAGCNGGTAGNYTTGVTYPILDNAAIAEAYQINYYPTLYVICPNKRAYEIDPLDADGLWEKAAQCPVALGTNNAGIFQFDPGTELHEICGTKVLSPRFALTNLGSAPLTQAFIELKWDTNTLQTLHWVGYLPTYGEAYVTLDSQSISNTGLLKTTITNINNGTGDDDFSNNVRNENFSDAVQFNTTQVLLKIRTDNYGEETYWEVRDEQGVVLEFGGNQEVGPNGGGAFPLGTPIGPGAYPNLTIIRDTLELPTDGCYSIHFSDGYGDGMCCDFGTGYYRLFNLDNTATALISGGEFDEYARRALEVGMVSSTAEPVQVIDFQIFPNPATDFLNISVETRDGLECSIRVFNAFGQLQHQFPTQKAVPGGHDWRLSLSGWAEGVYFLQCIVGREITTKAFVVEAP